jgi:hypothetical protein
MGRLARCGAVLIGVALGLAACSAEDDDGGNPTTTSGGNAGGAAGAAGSPHGGAGAGGADGGLGGGATGGGGAGGGCSAPGPPLVNALLASDGAVRALYPAPGTSGVSFEQQGSLVRALDGAGNELWSTDAGTGQLFGGFDFDQDGWPDLGVVHTEPLGQLCGSVEMTQTWLSFLQGQSGALTTPIAPLADLCWTFGTATYPTSQWTVLSVLFGPQSATITTVPYYATTGWFLHWSGGNWTSEAFFYPSTASYDATYDADLPNGWGTGTSYLANSHIPNGFMPWVGAEQRLAFFTSGRAVQYAVAPLSAGQLLADRPFLTGGRTDIAGRNYGLVARDPDAPSHVVLVSGTDGQALFTDMVNGAPGSDDWGQIERHVAVYDLATDTVDDTFYSYAHDDDDGHKYEGRVAYPDSPFVHTGAAGASRLAFNVFGAGHWVVHVTAAGASADAVTIADRYLWDIRDLDGDGVAEWVLSPAPSGYLPTWSFELHHWDEASTSLQQVASYPGYLPARVATFRAAERTTSRGSLYPTLTVAEGCALKVLGQTEASELAALALP